MSLFIKKGANPILEHLKDYFAELRSQTQEATSSTAPSPTDALETSATQSEAMSSAAKELHEKAQMAPFQLLLKYCTLLEESVQSLETSTLSPKHIALLDRLVEIKNVAPNKAEDIDLTPHQELLASLLKNLAGETGRCPVRNGLDLNAVEAYLAEPLNGEATLPKSSRQAAERGITKDQAEESASRRHQVISLLLAEPLINVSTVLEQITNNPALLQESVQSCWQTLIDDTGSVDITNNKFLSKVRGEAQTEHWFARSDAVVQAEKIFYAPKVNGPSLSLNQHPVGFYGERFNRAMAAASKICELTAGIVQKETQEEIDIFSKLTFDGVGTKVDDPISMSAAAIADGAASFTQLSAMLLMQGVEEVDDAGNKRLLPWSELKNYFPFFIGIVARLAGTLPLGFVQPLMRSQRGLSKPLQAVHNREKNSYVLKLPKEFKALIAKIKEGRYYLSVESESQSKQTSFDEHGDKIGKNREDLFMTETMKGCPMLAAMATLNENGEPSLGPSPLFVFSTTFLEMVTKIYESDMEL